jgi:hypothetical protein
MSDEGREKGARFARIREHIRESARRAGQATLAGGVLILSAPGGIHAQTAPTEIAVISQHEASAAERVSNPARVAEGLRLRDADFSDGWQKAFEDNWGKV